jgi:hypothetical protein
LSSTGAYELDLSLLNEPDRAWRTMHTQTNTWCSAAVVLPDKAARILNVAGWSDDASQGLRLYAPDGSPGVNGTNDWEEKPTALRLQVRWHIHSHIICKVSVLSESTVQSERWYPTALVLSNGSVLVMGGQQGPSGPNNPTLEILPRIPGGNTQVYLDFLNMTAPNNLYPFLDVLPSGLVFVGEFERIDSSNFAIDTHEQGMTMRHVFLTQYHSPPSQSFPTSLVLLRIPVLVAHIRMRLRPYSCPNTLPTQTQLLS